MPHPEPEEVTQLLLRLQDEHLEETARRTILDRLWVLVLDELRRFAHHQLQGERANHTLNTTALVNEAYLKLAHEQVVTWKERKHFIRVAARAMRQVLIDYARARNAEKRGGGIRLNTLGEMDWPVETMDPDDLIALHDALEHLKTLNEQHHDMVELRFFGGRTIQETADILGLSVQQVNRDWSVVKALLRAWLNK